MGKCETCRYWEGNDGRRRQYWAYGLRECERARQLWDVTGWDRDGNPELVSDTLMFVEDGSSYYAALLTKPDFGCVEYVEKTEV